MMRAVVVAATGGVEALQLKEVPEPRAKAGEIVVQNEFSGVNYIDTYHRTGIYPVSLPFVPGRCGRGIDAQA